MAQVTEKTQEHVDKLLSVSVTCWEQLPSIEAEFDDWKPDEKETFVVEWSIEEDRLRRLETLLNQGAMSKEQKDRYESLRALVARNRPIIEQLADR